MDAASRRGRAGWHGAPAAHALFITFHGFQIMPGKVGVGKYLIRGCTSSAIHTRVNASNCECADGGRVRSGLQFTGLATVNGVDGGWFSTPSVFFFCKLMEERGREVAYNARGVPLVV